MSNTTLLMYFCVDNEGLAIPVENTQFGNCLIWRLMSRRRGQICLSEKDGKSYYSTTVCKYGYTLKEAPYGMNVVINQPSEATPDEVDIYIAIVTNNQYSAEGTIGLLLNEKRINAKTLAVGSTVVHGIDLSGKSLFYFKISKDKHRAVVNSLLKGCLTGDNLIKDVIEG